MASRGSRTAGTRNAAGRRPRRAVEFQPQFFNMSASIISNSSQTAAGAIRAESDAIEARALSFRYGDREALSDVTFSIARGEIFGFLGPNGGGNTTLFKLLSTLTPIPSGSG